MPRPPERRFGLRYAIGLSAALHLLAAPLFAVSGAVLFGTGLSFELPGARADSLAITLERKASTRSVVRRSHLPSPVRERYSKKSPLLSVTPQLEWSWVSASKRTSASLRGGGSATITRIAIVTRKNLSPEITPPVIVTADSTPAPLDAPIPTVQATATPALTATTPLLAAHRGLDSTIGGWGQNFEKPLVADEAALEELRAKYHFSATITVRVDESGRAVRISVPDNVPIEARSEIERRLAALRYIPAECNGLHCAASLSIVI